MNKLLIKLSNFMVKFRYIFLIIFIIITIICSINLKNNFNYIENNKQDNIIKIKINNISYDDLLNRINSIKSIKHVKNISYNYDDNNVLMIIDIDLKIEKDITKILKNDNYNIYKDESLELKNNQLLTIILVIISLFLLLLISFSYFDIILFLIIYIISIIITNTSYIIQLILVFSYFLVIINNYKIEIDNNSNKIIALKKTLIKSIPILLISSIILLSITIPLSLLKLKICNYLGLVLTKTIIFNLLIIILLLPSIIYLFNSLILKLRHRNYFINTKKIIKHIISSKNIIFIIYIILIIISLLLIPKYKYIYNIKSLNNDFNINRLIIKVDKDNDYNKQLRLAKKLSQDKKIININSLGNTIINDNLYLGSLLNYKDISNLLDIDNNTSYELFKMYANNFDEAIKLNDIDNYHISFINLIKYLYELDNLDNNLKNKINNYYEIIVDKENYLENNKYSKIIIDYKSDIESLNTYKLINIIEEDISKEYNNIIKEGESIKAISLKNIFKNDLFLLLLMTILIIFIILLITKSISITIILFVLMQSSILITHLLFFNKYFIYYIIIYLINIIYISIYGIFITKKYLLLDKKINKILSIQNCYNNNYIYIFTISLLLIITGLLIYYLSNSILKIFGLLITISTFLSFILIIIVLPVLLYKFDKIIRNKNI